MNAYVCSKCNRISHSAANGALAPTRCAYEGCNGRIRVIRDWPHEANAEARRAKEADK